MAKRPVDRTAAQRQRARRERLARAGLRQRQVFVHDDDWPQVRELVERLRKARLTGAE